MLKIHAALEIDPVHEVTGRSRVDEQAVRPEPGSKRGLFVAGDNVTSLPSSRKASGEGGENRRSCRHSEFGM